jgi:6-phosphogluconolactonase
MSSKPQLHVLPSSEEVARAFADHLVKKLKEKEEGPLFWALSGGSTPKVLFRLLAEEYRDKIDWSRLYCFWGDDRMVPHDDPESNYGVAQQLLFDHVPVKKEQIFPVPTDLEAEEAAKTYAATLAEHLPRNSDGLPIFDVNMLGLGTDGHTASIFPDQMELLTDDRVCAVAEHPDSGQLRVTLTGPVLNASDEVVFLVTGRAKALRVAQILNEEQQGERLPAAHVRPTSGKLHWFLDTPAAMEVGY